MKVSKITESAITFDNKSMICFGHVSECCEYNYADLVQVESGVTEFEFDEELQFEEVEGYGFRFGSKNTPMFFVPCYSEQSGYYSSDVDIFYKGKLVLSVDAQEIDR